MATVRSGDKAVLMVVDVQVGVVESAWNRARVIENVSRAVERARAQGVPVIWVQHGDDDLPRDSAKWQWVPELRPGEGEPLVHKRFNSAFEDTELERVLGDLGATHIVLAGAATNWCIRATAYGALGGRRRVQREPGVAADPLDIGSDGRTRERDVRLRPSSSRRSRRRASCAAPPRRTPRSCSNRGTRRFPRA
jgi:hypothetical protein